MSVIMRLLIGIAFIASVNAFAFHSLGQFVLAGNLNVNEKAFNKVFSEVLPKVISADELVLLELLEYEASVNRSKGVVINGLVEERELALRSAYKAFTTLAKKYKLTVPESIVKHAVEVVYGLNKEQLLDFGAIFIDFVFSENEIKLHEHQ